MRSPLLSLGIISFVLVTSGVALSDTQPDLTNLTTVVPTDFDFSTGVLTTNGAEIGVSVPAYYFNVGNTAHLASVLHNLPPSPCDGLGQAWDMAVVKSQGGKNVTRQFLALLTNLAAHNCTLQATSHFDSTLGVQVLDSIGPVQD
jgi:hypothetical protein